MEYNLYKICEIEEEINYLYELDILNNNDCVYSQSSMFLKGAFNNIPDEFLPKNDDVLNMYKLNSNEKEIANDIYASILNNNQDNNIKQESPVPKMNNIADIIKSEYK